ncbi:hypothetical protein LTR53_014834 [Teratosphaeriaceae sp. CCFEE 6253]|nr:hypothetical protein LTR53_014834 [Teratosphaeriaceae sp. CCFEE 6253]
MDSPLCELPDEILILIAEHLQGQSSALRCLALTNQHFQAIAEPVLYRDIFLRTGGQLSRLESALQSGPSRAGGVRTFDVRCLPPKAGSRPLLDLRRILCLTPNIENVVLESPFCNNSAWKGMTCRGMWPRMMASWLGPFQHAALPGVSKAYSGDDVLGDSVALPTMVTPRPLQALKQLTLHLNGATTEFWTMHEDYAGIWAHPTLEILHLSSINIPDQATSSMPSGLRTPLKRLTLDEANVTLDGLRGVLSIPKALEYLYIGENRYSPGETRSPRAQNYNRLAARDAQAFVDTLALQKHSLRELVYLSINACTDSPVPHHRRQAVDLSMFEALLELTLAGCNDDCMLSWSPQHKAPPRLQRLTVDQLAFADNDIDAATPSNIVPLFFQQTVAAAPHLKQLSVRLTHALVFNPALPWYIRLRTIVERVGKYLSKAGCILHVVRPPGQCPFVRPILFGEEEAEDVVMYVNDEIGFRNNLDAGQSAWTSEEDGVWVSEGESVSDDDSGEESGLSDSSEWDEDGDDQRDTAENLPA